MNTDTAKKNDDLTVTISVDQSPEEVFDAINDVPAWWSGEIEGPTDELGGEFTYRYEKMHTSKQRVTELVRGERVVWLVLESHLDFIENKREWEGTRVIFEIARKGDKTELRFTHAGLVPAHACYGACSNAWGSLIRGDLKNLIEAKKGQVARAAS